MNVLRPPPAEGRGHLRLGGAPALAPPAAARARLGRPHADAARGRARRMGLRARARRARGVPLDAIPVGADVDPLAFLRLVALPCAPPPGHPAHAPRARGRLRPARRQRSRACRSAFSTKHGFNEFREGRRLRRSPTGPSPSSRTCTSPSRAGWRATSRRRRASTSESFEIVHYGIDPDGEPKPLRGRSGAAALRRPPDPDQGPHRAPARIRRGASATLPGLELDIAGRGPLEPALRALAGELGIGDSVRFLGHVSPIQAAIERVGDRRRPVDGRGLRHGRARGDGALAPRDRGRDRRARRARAGRRDRPPRPAGRGRAARGGDRRRSPATPRSRAAWARPVGAARSRTSCRRAAPTGRSCSTSDALRRRSSAPH